MANSTKVTWSRFAEVHKDFFPELVGDGPFSLWSPARSCVKCVCPLCGDAFEAAAQCIWNGKTRSCGCLRRKTAKKRRETSTRITAEEATQALSRIGIAPLAPLPTPLDNVSVAGRYRFLCKCGSTFGDSTSLQSLILGNTRSCGCAKKEAAIQNGILKRGTFTDVQRAYHKTLWNVSRVSIEAALGAVGSSLSGEIPDLVSTRQPVTCTCRCARSFTVRAADIVRKFSRTCGCIKSGTELELFDFVKSIAPTAIHNDRSVIGPKEIDVLVPGVLGIEMHGLYWHGEKRGKCFRTATLLKVEAIAAAGLRPMIFFEDEWHRHRSAVEGFIRAALGAKRTIGARKTMVVDGGADFIRDNHIQGASRSTASYSLQFEGGTVAAVQFNKLRGDRAGGEPGSYLLSRYCVGPAVSVSGGLGKLLAHFWRMHPDATRVVTYADRRYSTGDLYMASGFEKTLISRPTYSVFKGSGGPTARRRHRFAFRKEALAARGMLLPGETEAECLRRHRYRRIWDAGKVKWETSRVLRP